LEKSALENENKPANARRRSLLIATGIAGGAATVAAAAPFVASMLPSSRARAAGAPIEVGLQGLEEGKLRTEEWRGKPIWVVRRSPEMLAMLPKVEDHLADPASSESEQPKYCTNQTRSIKPEFFVVIGICTHLGCSPTKKLEAGAASGLGEDWPGGFFCPCHGSRFDLAGRVFKDVPAPTNLVVPPHTYLSDSTILIGEDPKS
jgi:ubiquinol-cytochrome c reductase iron-sulfur subunit